MCVRLLFITQAHEQTLFAEGDFDLAGERNAPAVTRIGVRQSFLLLEFQWLGVQNISELMINEQIRDKEVRVIGENGEQLGVMPVKEALSLAKEAELDLVKIAPTAKPPVCKIIDYGKYRYEQARKEKEARKKQKTVEVKEIRLSPNIDENDMNTKVNSARKFISKGNKVKITLRFRGREMTHMQENRYILDNIAESLSDIAVVDRPIKQEGRNLSLYLAEKAKGSTKHKEEQNNA